ncbi:hypothetical protein DPMN_182040 [Dreissena polymorpha]|uniref:Uncharacterized protein n=1 Tax=Dreissena polymorpha TaxID=45954 RepID=A0A9D4I5T9_DREPO|nr:hypothetical protein DPMN_182040 [Dreissena polymorpha]
MCTLLDEMVASNWLGISHQVGQGIQRMLEDSGVNPGLCPQPPQVITIDHRPLPLPTIPPALYWFVEVWVLVV